MMFYFQFYIYVEFILLLLTINVLFFALTVFTISFYLYSGFFYIVLFLSTFQWLSVVTK